MHLPGIHPTSTVVKSWQTTETTKASVLKLAATVSSLPGSTPGSAPFMGKIPTAAPGGDDSAMNAALQSAQEKLNVTEAAYTASQTNYQKAVETRSRVEQELAKIKGNLKNLQRQQAQMEEIKKDPNPVYCSLSNSILVSGCHSGM